MWPFHHHQELEELAEKIRKLLYKILGDKLMAQVQFTVTITVNPPAPPPLAEGASSGSAVFQQGVASSVVLTSVTGGVGADSVSVDALSAALPAGLTASLDASNNLVLTSDGTAVAGTASVVLDVNDSATPVVAPVVAAKLE
jgi:hypothetical protein